MKNLLQLNGMQLSFYEPYYIYDYIYIYDKTAKDYVLRRRASAISYSMNGEIVVTTAVCSDKDPFIKKQARAILNNRLLNVVEKIELCQYETMDNIHSEADSTYFSSYDVFTQYCDAFDNNVRLFFTPYKIPYLARIPTDTFVDNKGVTRTQVTSKIKHLDSLKQSPANVYLHKDFVNASYAKFMKVVSELSRSQDFPTYGNKEIVSTPEDNSDVD